MIFLKSSKSSLFLPYLFTLLLLLLLLSPPISSVKVSVIIPVYNTEPFLPRSINSVLEHTLQDIEIICVNDGSTDHSQEILEAFEAQDPRIKVVSLDTNMGPGYARNVGMNLATGEFIGFIDSDDYIDEKYYENLYNHSPGYDIVKGIFVDSLNGSGSYIHHVNLRNITGYVVDSIFRRSFLDAHDLRFPEEVRLEEDVQFRKDCYAHHPRLFEVPDNSIYYYYKQREGSTWKKSKKTLHQLYKKIRNQPRRRIANIKTFIKRYKIY